jgi:hypothetical protein
MSQVSAGRSRRRMVLIFALSAVVAVNAGCGTEDENSSEQALAEQLVASTQAAGVAPRLTVDAAESLYGTDAPAVCGAFDGELLTSASNVLRGRLGLSRRKTITDEAIAYGALVVQTYCPEFTGNYDAVVADLDPFERSDS